MTLAIAGVPVIVLITLVILGYAAAGPALLGMTVILAASLVVAVRCEREFDIIEAALSHTTREGSLSPPMNLLRPTGARGETIARDIERLSRITVARAVLLDQLQRSDASIVEQLPDPLIIINAERDVRRTNAAARSAFGDDMLAVLRHPGLRAAIDRAFAHGAPQNAELLLPVPMLREVHATVIVMDPPLLGGGKGIIVLSDRTRERAVERTRADFVANASHELRTPLSSLIGFIDTLRGAAANDPNAQERFLSIMAEQAARMNRLIDDLLSLSRIELMEHQPPSAVVDLSILIPSVASGFEPAIRNRNIRFLLQLTPGLPMVTGDADQLAQVLQNVLDNAVKYGRESGSVIVKAFRSSEGDRWANRAGVVISVHDDGLGIGRNHISRLTERFYRVDQGRSRAQIGTGLGLAIVKHIINRHRGQLVIESEEGVGTTVLVWLPHAPRTRFESGSDPAVDPSESA